MNTPLFFARRWFLVRTLPCAFALLAAATTPAQTIYVSVYHAQKISKVVVGGSTTDFVTGLNYPTGLAFDSSGNLYVSNQGSGVISKITPGGAVSTFASGFNNPTGLAFDNSGNLYVASSLGGGIKMVTPDGSTTTTFVTTSDNIQDLVFDLSGNLYAADVTLNQVKLITSGGTVSTFASITSPTGLVFDASGTLYVTRSASNSIDMVSGATVTSFSTSAPLSSPNYLALGGTALFVANGLNGELFGIASDGTYTTLANYGYGTAGGPWDVAISSIPEPSTYAALLGLAAIAAAAYRRRCRK